MKFFTSKSKTNFILLFIAFVSGILLSSKWSVMIMPWIHFTVLLRFFRTNNWKGYLLAIPILSLASIIGNYGVFPMDIKSLIIFMVVINTIGLIPYVIERFCYNQINGWVKTLFFPVILTTFIFLLDQGPQGSWGNIAYTQYGIKPLIQIASITGIYGINFLFYWFASSIIYWVEQKNSGDLISRWNFAMPVVFFICICFGIFRLNSDSNVKSQVVVSAITIDNPEVIEEMYSVETGKTLKMPKEVSQSDPILGEFQIGMNAFMADPENPKFSSVYLKMDEVLEEYFEATKNAVEQGAKIITWSEATIMDLKNREKITADKVSHFADEMDIYLFFPTAVFHPEKVGKESKFMENKVLTFGPDGALLNTYFKNIPVMGIEPSFPGDGTIPIIETEFGNLSPIICFDADHAGLISQIGKSGTDMLVVPTGDWKDISPAHTYMAAVRCIENGVSMLKSASNGLSAVIDDKGRILDSYDYFDGEKIKSLVYTMNISTSKTFYNVTAPLFGLLIQVSSLMIIIYSIINFFIQRKKLKVQA